MLVMDTTPLVKPPAPTRPPEGSLPLPADIRVSDSTLVDIALAEWTHDEETLQAYRDAQDERGRRTIPLALAVQAKARAQAFEIAMARAIEDGDPEGVLTAALGRADALREAEALKWVPPHLRGAGPAAARLKALQEARSELRAYWAAAMLEANLVPDSMVRHFDREAVKIAHQLERASAALKALENDPDPRRTKAANAAMERPTALLAQARELVSNRIPAQAPYVPKSHQRKASA